MLKNQAAFEFLIAEALRQDFSGWDFSFLEGRWHADAPSWDYEQIVRTRSRTVTSLLDLGTGGGEVLARLAPFPASTWATESYAPNVPIAERRLAPFGCQVVHSSSEGILPFGDNQFELIINRHETIAASEIYRVLCPGGYFITQQVGGQHNTRLNEWLGGSAYAESYWTLAYARDELEQAGFEIVEQKDEHPALRFDDIGAIVYYLKVIPWQVADFSVEKYYPQLVDLHNRIQDERKVVVASHYFYLEAQKRAS